MITLPTAFFDRKYSGGSDACLVVYITNNAGTGFLFAEHPIFPSSGADVLGLLYDISPVTHGFDYYTCEYQPAHLTASIANLWSKKTAAGVWHRASDFMPDGSVNGLWGQRLQVYWWPGAGETILTQGLKVFDGSITGMTMQGEDRLNIQADEVWDSYFKIQVPQRRATRSIFRNLPTENINKTMPLVYGPHNELAFLRNTGFALGQRVDKWTWVFADHVIDSFYDEPRPDPADITGFYTGNSKALWIYIPGVKSWARSYFGVTFNVNDSGRATAVIDPDTAGWDVYLYPTSAAITSSGTDAANDVGVEASFDNDEATKVSIVANSATEAQIIYEWNIDGGADTFSVGEDTPAVAAGKNDKQNNVAELPGPTDGPSTTYPMYGVDLSHSIAGGITIASAKIEWWAGATWNILVNDATVIPTSVTTMHHYTGLASAIYGEIQSIRWHLNTGRGDAPASDMDQKPFKIRITYTGTGWTINSTVVAYIHECRLVVSCKTPRDKSQVVGKKAINYKVDEINVLGQKTGRKNWMTRYEDVADIASDIVGASVTGREYGAWIDAAPGARTNGKNAGDQISTAAGVLESLLRDEMLVADADINPTSFDDVHNASDVRGVSINLLPGSSASIKSIVDRIGFEHRLVLYRARGNTTKFTLVDARGRTGSAGTILLGELAEMPEVGMTPFDPRNAITFNYRRLPHDGKFFKSETITDTTSTGEYGTVTQDIALETIKNTVWMDPIKDSLIETPGFMASRARYLVTFRTKGLRWAGLELGDVFQFHDDLDDQLLCFGETWLNREFLVYEASVLRDSTIGNEFRAISILPADL